MKKYAGELVDTIILMDGVERATKYLSPTMVMRAHRLPVPDRKKSAAMVVVVCPPDKEERRFIRQCQKAGEPFPVKRIQLEYGI
jgi:hypothetical protein